MKIGDMRGLAEEAICTVIRSNFRQNCPFHSSSQPANPHLLACSEPFSQAWLSTMDGFSENCEVGAQNSNRALREKFALWLCLMPTREKGLSILDLLLFPYLIPPPYLARGSKKVFESNFSENFAEIITLKTSKGRQGERVSERALFSE